MNCPNCNSKQDYLVREVKILGGKYSADLRHCGYCDFLYLDDPVWLTDAYKNEFYADTGYVQRNLENAKYLRSLLLIYELINGGKKDIVGCDLGTGLGMLPRLMRDYGYEFWGMDEYSDMQLIRPYVNPTCDLSVYTAFEVIEHIQSLPDFLRSEILGFKIFIFSTLLRKNSSVPEDSWWYYAFTLGQHISFHSRKSLSYAIKEAGLSTASLVSVNQGLHLLTFDRDWNHAVATANSLRKIKILSLVTKLLLQFNRRPSLVMSDHVSALKVLYSNQV